MPATGKGTKTEAKEHSLKILFHWATGRGQWHLLRALLPTPQASPHCIDGLLKTIIDLENGLN